MNRQRKLFAGVVGFLLAATVAEAELRVRILQPGESIPLFGAVRIVVTVEGGEGTEKIDLILDGAPVGTVEQPPYELLVDFGEDNREHRLEAVARADSGAMARAAVLIPAIHVDDEVQLDLQQIYATVTGRRGQRVLGLKAEDFELKDEGDAQTLVTVASGEIPFSAVVLVDASSSMEEEQRAAAWAGVRAFAETMADHDEAKLFAFTDQRVGETPFTEDAAVIVAALPDGQISGGTALYDHLYWSIRELDARLSRKVVLLLSDGVDIHSALRMTEVRKILRLRATQLYWIFIPRPGQGEQGARAHHSFLPPEEIKKDQELLRKAVRETGGRVVHAVTPEEIREAFVEILKELREQYALGYYPEPKGAPGTWHRLRLKTRGQGLKVRTREGYFVSGVTSSPP